MNLINVRDNQFVITWKAKDREQWFLIKDAVKSIQGSTWKKGNDYWTVPVSANSSIAIADLAEKYGFVVHTDAEKQIEQTAGRSREMIDLSLNHEAVDTNFGLKKELWPFQKVGIQYGILSGNHLNGDGPGVGKTPQAIGLVHTMGWYPCIVITVKRNKIPFMQRWREFTDETSISVWTQEKRGNARVDIIDFGMVDKLADYIINYRQYQSVIIDEIHYCKNKSTKRYKACKAITEKIEHVNGYTGSIIINKVRELYTILTMIRRDKMFGNEWQFMNTYANSEKKMIYMRNPRGGKAIQKPITEFYGIKNEKALYTTLRANCFIGRQRRDVMKDLPPVTIDHIDISLTFSDEDNAELKGSKKDLELIVDDLFSKKEGSLEYKVLEDQAKGNIFKIRAAVGRAKLPGQREWLEDFLESGEKIIIYAHHKEVQQEVASWFPKGAVISSGQSEEESQTQVDKFTNDPECLTITCSIMAGQEALNLQAACYMAVLEEPWTQKDIDQMMGKMDRGEQNRAMMMYHLACMSEGSVDQIIMEIRKKKAEMAQISSTKYFIEKFLKL